MKTESQPKFTPGPWLVNSRAKMNIRTEDGIGVCSCGGEIEYGEACANAALIAQAPAMYAKLQEIAESMDKFGFERTATEIYSLLAAARGEGTNPQP